MTTRHVRLFATVAVCVLLLLYMHVNLVLGLCGTTYRSVESVKLECIGLVMHVSRKMSSLTASMVSQLRLETKEPECGRS